MKLVIKSVLGAIGTAAIATTVAAVTAISAPVAANAATFTFGNIFDKSGDPADNQNGVTDGIATQFTFEVLADTTNTSKWIFRNNSSTPTVSHIAQIYVDWTSPLGVGRLNAPGTTPDEEVETSVTKKVKIAGRPVTVTEKKVETIVKVLFTQGSGNLPQANGNTTFRADLALDADKPGSDKQGIDVGESLAVIFRGGSADDIEKAINLGQLRVGLHVQGITDRGFSDSYINTIPTPPVKPVPVPGFLLGLGVAGAFGGSRLLKNKKQSA